MTTILANRRARLVMLLLLATAAISVLAFRAAGASVSYYLEPHEYLADQSLEGSRVRVAGRVVGDTVVEEAGRPVAFQIVGDIDDRVSVSFKEGVVPNLFGPYALVIVEGVAKPDRSIDASSLIIKHEDEFFSEQPPAGSISSYFVDPTTTPDPEKKN